MKLFDKHTGAKIPYLQKQIISVEQHPIECIVECSYGLFSPKLPKLT